MSVHTIFHLMWSGNDLTTAIKCGR